MPYNIVRFRKLRIAWSTVWLLLAAALCVLWWRSYWKLDMLTKCDVNHIKTTIGSQSGEVYFDRYDTRRSFYQYGINNRWVMQQNASHGWKIVTEESRAVPKLELRWGRNADGFTMGVPHLYLVIPVVVAGAMPLLTTRYSVQSILIATALFAVLLGVGLSLYRI
jgi:hypothetical protein